MENASKALIIAAGVLIGIMILSLAVYLFANFGSTAARIEKENSQNELIRFNTQFTKYDGMDRITIYDIVTVANLAKDNNAKYDYTTEDRGKGEYISVLLDGNNVENLDDIINSLIKDNNLYDSNNDIKNYKVDKIEYYNSGKIKMISFKEE